ncbi:MAG: penicillin-binding protein 2 [Actinomycetales bacterium]|nr:penicillin-binding protein 2 [Actinomycetales bacterium]
MNKELRRVSAFVLVLFLALFSSSTIVQFFQSNSLKEDPRNVRTLYASFSTERGPILAGDQQVAYSTPVDDDFQYLRVYPDGPLYSAATGYFTLDQGATGVESELNSLLSGTSDSQFLDRVTSILTGQEPKGAAVELSIDPVVQQAAWDALGDYQGAVLAIEPATGRILALVSKPTFDPNALAVHDSAAVIDLYDQLLADPGQPLINRTIQGDLNPPGSTFKLVVASAALESGKYTPDSAFPNPAQLQLPQSTAVIQNSGGGTCGPGATVTIATALRLSCNIPFAELGLELGFRAISEQAKKYGFGDDSFEIPMPVAPSVYPAVQSDAELMLSAFGQGNDRVTPLQMAMVSAAIANGGLQMRPGVVDKVTAPDLSALRTFSPAEYGRPISAATAATMTQLMVANVANGAASNARIGGIDVAGKTGTAENGPGEPYTLWFTGFAPADSPQVAVAVVIEDGGGLGQEGYGNLLAAPIGKQVMEAVIDR